MATGSIQVFESKEFGKVRGLMIDGESWIVGKDVAVALGYANYRRAFDHVDAEDRRYVLKTQIGPLEKHHQIPNRGLTFINESGVYSLVLSSKLPTAKKFKHWVTSEVLPSLRKHGAYIEPKTLERMIADPDFMIRVFTELKREKEKRMALEKENAVMKPKATYCDQILACKETVPISLIAKDYGWTAVRMNRFLHDKGVIYRVGLTWVPYAAYQDKGYTKTRTIRAKSGRAVINQEWTQEGRIFLYDLMKQNGFLPLVEKKGEGHA